MKIEFGQIFTQIVSFLVMLWVLKRYAWKPLFDILDARRDKIAQEFATIEQQKKANLEESKGYAEKLRQLDLQGQKVIQEAKVEGMRLYKQIESSAHAQAKSIIDKAHEELRNEIAKARYQLKERLVEISIAATQKLIETELKPEQQKKLIEEFIETAELP